jgi:hypothetical protein
VSTQRAAIDWIRTAIKLLESALDCDDLEESRGHVCQAIAAGHRANLCIGVALAGETTDAGWPQRAELGFKL